MPVDPNFLRDWTLNFIDLGVAALVTEHIMESAPLQRLTPQIRRYVSLLIASLIACLVFILYCWLVNAYPADARAWANDLTAVSFLATIGSQTLHGALHLSNKPKAKPTTAPPPLPNAPPS